jgi:hypothetical protein
MKETQAKSTQQRVMIRTVLVFLCSVTTSKDMYYAYLA